MKIKKWVQLSKSRSNQIIVRENKCVGCRICQLWCSYIQKKKFIPSEAFIQIKNEYDLVPEISFLKGCTKCGQCVQYCLYGALDFKEVVE